MTSQKTRCKKTRFGAYVQDTKELTSFSASTGYAGRHSGCYTKQIQQKVSTDADAEYDAGHWIGKCGLRGRWGGCKSLGHSSNLFSIHWWVRNGRFELCGCVKRAEDCT